MDKKRTTSKIIATTETAPMEIQAIIPTIAIKIIPITEKDKLFY